MRVYAERGSRTSSTTGSGLVFYREIDSETQMAVAQGASARRAETLPTAFAVLATWDLSALLFDPRQVRVRAFLRETYVRHRKKSSDLLKTIEHAREAIRRVEVGVDVPALACAEARGAIAQIEYFQ